jgi:hypothetical protein
MTTERRERFSFSRWINDLLSNPGRGRTFDPPQEPVKLAMIALADESSPPEQDLFRDLIQTWKTPLAMRDLERAEMVYSFDVLDGFGAVSFMNVPIPWGDLEQACKNSFLWPEAEPELRKHRAHAIVVYSNPKLDPVDNAYVLTQIVATVARNIGAIGVYWGAAGLVHSTSMFLELAENAKLDDPPTPLWVGLMAGVEPSGLRNAFTRGMDALGFLDIEANGVKDPKGDLPAFIFDVVHFVLANKTKIQDGHTVGMTAEQKVKVRIKPSKWMPKEMLVLEIKDELDTV